MELADANLLAAMTTAASDLEHLVAQAEKRLGGRSPQFMSADETMIAMMAGRASDVAAMLRREAERGASADDEEYRKGLLRLAGWVCATIVAILIGVGLTTDDLDLGWIPGIEAESPGAEEEDFGEPTSVDDASNQREVADGDRALGDTAGDLRARPSLKNLALQLQSLVSFETSNNGFLVGDDRTIVTLDVSRSGHFPHETVEVFCAGGRSGSARAIYAGDESSWGSLRIFRSESSIGATTLRLGSSEEIAIGDKVSILGFARKGPEARSGVVVGVTAEGLISLGEVLLEDGYLGAPVLDSSGAVIGIVANRSPRSLGGLAVPSEKIREALATAD